MIFSSLKRMIIYLFFQAFDLFGEVGSVVTKKLNLFEGEGARYLASISKLKQVILNCTHP